VYRRERMCGWVRVWDEGWSLVSYGPNGFALRQKESQIRLPRRTSAARRGTPSASSGRQGLGSELLEDQEMTEIPETEDA